MNFIRRLFPLSFGVANRTDLIVRIVLFLVVGIVINAVCSVLGIFGFLVRISLWVLCVLTDLYILASIALVLINYFRTHPEN